MPRKKSSLFEDAKAKMKDIIDVFVEYRSKEGKDVNPAAIGILKESINRIEEAIREVERFEKFLYFAGKGDTLFIVNNETGEIRKGSIEQVIKSVRDIKEVL